MRLREALFSGASLSSAISGIGTPSMLTLGSHSSQVGKYRLRSPRSFIVAGTRTDRTMVASSATATAGPKPICCNATSDAAAKPPKTATMMAAAPVIRAPVVRSP